MNDFFIAEALRLGREDYTDTGTIDAEDLQPTIPDSWRMFDDVEVMTLPDPEYLIDGILPRRSVGVLVAPPGIGKTTLAASIAVHVATGRDWFGHRVCYRGSSIAVCAEDPSGYKIRLRAKKVADRLPLDMPIGVYTFPDMVDMREPVSVARFSTFLKRAFESGDAPRECSLSTRTARRILARRKTPVRTPRSRWGTRSSGATSSG